MLVYSASVYSYTLAVTFNLSPTFRSTNPSFLHSRINLERMRSLISVVAAADNFPPHEGLYPLYHPTTREVYTPFHLSLADYEYDLLPVGLLRPSVLLELQAEVEEHESSAGTGGGAFGFVKERNVHHDGAMVEKIKAVHFADWVIKEKKMTEVMGKLAEKLRSGGKYLPALRGTFTFLSLFTKVDVVRADVSKDGGTSCT